MNEHEPGTYKRRHVLRKWIGHPEVAQTAIDLGVVFGGPRLLRKGQRLMHDPRERARVRVAAEKYGLTKLVPQWAKNQWRRARLSGTTQRIAGIQHSTSSKQVMPRGGVMRRVVKEGKEIIEPLHTGRIMTNAIERGTLDLNKMLAGLAGRRISPGRLGPYGHVMAVGKHPVSGEMMRTDAPFHIREMMRPSQLLQRAREVAQAKGWSIRPEKTKATMRAAAAGVAWKSKLAKYNLYQNIASSKPIAHIRQSLGPGPARHAIARAFKSAYRTSRMARI